MRPPDVPKILVHANIAERHVIALLRNRSLTSDNLQAIYDHPDWIKSYGVQVGLVRHPKAPRVMAQALVRFLFWKDLSNIADDLKVHPVVRRLADNLLAEKLGEMSLGEKIALARAAGRGVIRTIRKESEPRVVEALLRNFRFTEDDVIAMLSNPDVSVSVLQTIGRNRKWTQRRPIRLALVRHRHTPPAVSLGLLSGLLARDLAGISESVHIHPTVRSAATRALAAKKVSPNRG